LLLQATLEIERAKKQAKEEIQKEALEVACLILRRILQEEGAANLIKEITSKQIKDLPETLPK
jgi:F0F1-type ATP synthase membrane subunit b/b'